MFLRIIVFYVLVWFFLLLAGGIQQETGLLPPEICLAQWGPGIAALRYLFVALIPAGVGLINGHTVGAAGIVGRGTGLAAIFDAE